MTASLPTDRPVHVSIRNLQVSGASPLEARRLADALPAALNRAMARLAAGGPPPRRMGPDDRVADQIAQTVAGRLERAP